MFDVSFGKLAILFALCLIVLGPEKLPKLAQQLGRWTGQARAMARHFRSQLEQELAAEELLKEKRELERKLAEPFTSTQETLQSAASEVSSANQAITSTVTDTANIMSDTFSHAHGDGEAGPHTTYVDPPAPSVEPRLADAASAQHDIKPANVSVANESDNHNHPAATSGHTPA